MIFYTRILKLSQLFLVIFSFSSLAQKSSYPKGYYQFPIRPGLTNSLAGVLGDLRTNHFHGGADIRTQQREGLSVHAAAKGYVPKVAVQRGGYGNVIYLRHSNGQTTVYGHLLEFSKELADYVKSKQYEKQTFEIELYPDSNQFIFEKGSVIALSGNTGGSAGPHLHFEIRDSQDNYLNPLFFGFKEIIDTKPPKFVSLAVRPLDIDGRVNQKFERQQFRPVKLKDGSFRLNERISASGTIGIDLQAFDEMTGTGFRYGLQCIEIKLDGHEIFSYNMEIFPNSATREYNNLIDYATEQETGQRYLKCYIPDGNQFQLYKTDAFKGKIFIGDTLNHHVEISISDSYENVSKLTFDIQGEQVSEPLNGTLATSVGMLESEMYDHVFKIKAQEYSSVNPKAIFFTDGKSVELDPYKVSHNASEFLIDLRKYLPDTVQIGKSKLVTDLKTALLPGLPQVYKESNWSIQTDFTSLFDTLYVQAKCNPASLVINNKGVALRDYVTLTFHPELAPVNKERTNVYRYVNGDYRFVGGVWNGNSVEFRTRELGVFVIKTDTIGPKVRLIEHSPSQIRGYISDSDSGIESFNAYINDKWVLMNYDYKRNLIWSDKLDNEPFTGDLTIKVTDRAGNNTILHTQIVQKTNTTKKTKR